MGRAPLRASASIILLLATTVAVPSAQERDPFESMGVLRVIAPAAAPDVTFRTLDGRPARLSELRGRPVLLTFFTTW